MSSSVRSRDDAVAVGCCGGGGGGALDIIESLSTLVTKSKRSAFSVPPPMCCGGRGGGGAGDRYSEIDETGSGRAPPERTYCCGVHLPCGDRNISASTTPYSSVRTHSDDDDSQWQQEQQQQTRGHKANRGR